MTPDELVAQLAPIRVPADFARFGLQDALAVISLGLLAGLIIAWLLRFASRPARDPASDLRSEVAALSDKDPETRLAGLAAILRRNDKPLPPGLADALYDPTVSFDPAIAERAALAVGVGEPAK